MIIDMMGYTPEQVAAMTPKQQSALLKANHERVMAQTRKESAKQDWILLLTLVLVPVVVVLWFLFS